MLAAKVNEIDTSRNGKAIEEGEAIEKKVFVTSQRSHSLAA